MEDRCICCGKTIPKGSISCPNCMVRVKFCRTCMHHKKVERGNGIQCCTNELSDYFKDYTAGYFVCRKWEEIKHEY